VIDKPSPPRRGLRNIDNKGLRKRALFREVNGRIRDVASAFGDASSYDLLCECARVDCLRRVVVPGRVYDELESDGTRYVVYPGHERRDEERVLSGDASYLVVAPRSEPLGDAMPAPA
jgi:hypothetical protein